MWDKSWRGRGREGLGECLLFLFLYKKKLIPKVVWGVGEGGGKGILICFIISGFGGRDA